MITKAEKTAIIEQYKTHEGDTGSPEVQIAILTHRINTLTDSLAHRLTALRTAIHEVDSAAMTPQERADFYRDTIIPAMEALRESADGLEVLVAKDLWPLPSYGDMLFSVR